jgi:Calx-beta domain
MKPRSRTILISAATLALCAAPLAAQAEPNDTTVTVTPSSPHGFSDPDTAGGGSATLTAIPPEVGTFGPGYLALTTVDDNSSKADFLSSEDTAGGRPLSDLTGTSYMVYRDSTSTGSSLFRPSLQLPVYQNVAPGSSGANYNTLVFEPQYCYTNLADDTWQTVNGDHQDAGTLGCYHFSKAPDTYYKTLADVEAAFPNATLLGYGFNLGSYQPGTKSRVDDLELAFTDGTKTYDFEAADRTPPPPALTATIGDSTVTEGDTGTTPADFTVTLNRPSVTDTTVHYTTSDGSASVADSDYRAKTGDLVIPAGQTTGTITVLVNGDTKVEGNEVFHVTVTSTDATVTPASYATGNITNDDSATPPAEGKPRISIGDATTVERNSGTHAMKFAVQLSKSYKSAVTVHYTTADGSAHAGSDYVAKSGTLSIKAGSKVGYISVLVKGDKSREPSESFFVTISNATNGSIADPNGSGVIQNDDK